MSETSPTTMTPRHVDVIFKEMGERAIRKYISMVDDDSCFENMLDWFDDSEFDARQWVTALTIELSTAYEVNHIQQPEFTQALMDWADTKNQSMYEMVRGYVPDGDGGFWMFHGHSDGWVSAELLGGDYDGVALKKFNKWTRENYGIKFGLPE
jgi:hypothetical protein